MKKLLICVLAFALVFSALAASAIAAGSVTVSVALQSGQKDIVLTKADLANGKEMTVKFSVSGAESLKALQFTVVVPDGFEPVSKGGAKQNDYELSNGKFAFTSVDGEALTDLFTLTLRATNAAANKDASYEIEVKDVKYAIENSADVHADGKGVALGGITVKHDDDAHVFTGESQTTDPTCTTAGEKTATCACGEVKKTPVDPTGHNLTITGPTWTVNEQDKTKDTAKFHVTCSHTNCPTYYAGGSGVDVDAKVVSVPGKAACISGGTITYTASIEIEDPYFKDTNPNYADGKWQKTDKEHSQTVDALGHQWDEAQIIWPELDADNPTAPVTVKLSKCARCGLELEKQVTPQAGEKVEPKCEEEGSQPYTGRVTFGPDDDTGGHSAGLSKTEEKTWNVKIAATGHLWPETVDTSAWKWEGVDDVDGEYPTATVTVECQNTGKCNGKYDTDGLELTATVTRADGYKAATCEEGGIATFNATATTENAGTGTGNTVKYEAEAQTETYASLGHKWAGKDKVVIEWTGDAKSGWKADKATRPCENDPEHQQTGTVTVTAEETKKATYEEEGVTTYKATVHFDEDKNYNGKNEALDYEDTTSKVEPIAKLTPEVEAPAVKNETAVETKPDLTALGTAVNDLVKDALSSDSAPAGMDKTLYDLIRKAGASVTPDDLTVTTELVVEDEDTAALTGLPAGAADKVKDAFDITIQVTVSGSGVDGETVKTGYITEIDESIPFTVKLPEGGPIWYVLSDHGGTWHEIDSRVENGNIVFTTSQFSKFALISSSDLADAVVTPSAIPDQTYTGSPIQPKVELTVNGGQKLTEGKDYVVAYENNTDVTDAAKIVITPAEGSAFTGRIELTFKIVKAPAAGGSGSSTKPTEAPVPATGDETPVALYAVMLTLSAAALTFVLARRRRQK